jgi:tyrosinase
MRHASLLRSPSRRAFLSSLAAAAGLLPFTTWVSALAQPAPLAMRIRAEASSREGQKMLELYQRAVGMMQEKLPMHHPHSWRFQANTHQYPANEPIRQIFTPAAGETPATVTQHRKFALGTEHGGNPGNDRIWRTCPHGDPQFLPWHRLYLAYFEQIVEKVVGQPFALPYWGYLDKNRRQLPEMFRPETIAGKRNWLFFSARNSQFLREGLRDDLIIGLSDDGFESILRTQALLGNPRRNGFSQNLEGDLHDLIHTSVGTRAGMGNPEVAARDPIFWLHHASIDRIWESWRAPGRDGSSPRDPHSTDNWYKPKYAFMNAKAERAGDGGPKFVLQAANNLRYSYDELLPSPSAPVALGPEVPSSNPPTKVQEGAVPGSKIQRAGDSVTIALQPSVNEGVALGLSNDPSTRYDLVLRLHAATEPGAYQVYLKTSPEGGGPETEVLVATFSLFTVGGGHTQHGAAAGPVDFTRSFDVTAKVRAGQINPLRPGNVIIRASYLDEPVDITVTGAEIIAK